MSGALALVGSGEYTPAMNETDRALLDTLGGPREARVVVLPTASGLEPGMPEQWNARGVRHFQALGAQVTPVALITREDAHRADVLAALEGANFFYFSGGSPQYAIETWRDTPAWAVVVDRFRAGAVVAGCSAGAMMLGSATISVRGILAGQPPRWDPALGLVPGVVTLPHFDRMHSFMDDARFTAVLDSAPAGITVLGVDEDTALLNVGGSWRVLGRQGVTVFAAGQRSTYQAGGAVPLAAMGL